MLMGPATFVVALVIGLLVLAGVLLVRRNWGDVASSPDCSRCGHRNRRGARYCGRCGRPLR